ncbi:HTH-type transcriptional regulator XynR [Bacillus rhizoplanae]|uniref:HTH-type transcriptional regulator XynR n=1 Tax=Bacillus rhizoplanae TaxID=2880966 RepID=A0ABM8YGH7_9BACI|nr:IclR family transcriptional regulator [Bacillus rhizoplanae]CAG9614932.1 HTH-type transcriptional regulator XynR [Bacillus rhizoplanae]
MTKDKRDGKRFTTLENALRLLELFSSDDPELGINEIADRLEIANSTAHRLATTLLSEGFIAKDLHTKLYRLGTPILALGNIVTRQSKLHMISQPVLEALVHQANETAHIGILRGNEVMYLNKIECSHPLRLLSYMGKRNPIHCTSTGQVLLAHQSPKFIEEFLLNKLERYTPKTITDSHTLFNRLKQIKKQGYFLSIEELCKGVSSISAPIQNPNGQVIASIGVAGPIQRINNHTAPKLIKLITNSTHEISHLLRTM